MSGLVEAEGMRVMRLPNKAMDLSGSAALRRQVMAGVRQPRETQDQRRGDNEEVL